MKATRAGYVDSTYKTSMPVSVTYTVVAPATITVPTITSTTGNFTVSWAAATGVTGANYVLDVSTEGGTTFTNAYTGTATSASITGLGNGTYLYRVKATLAPYTDSAYKTSAPVRVLLTAVAPATITVPTTSITGNFTVSWGASSTSGVTYVLEKSSDGATYTQVYSGTATSATITGLVGPATCTLRVKAIRTGYVDSAYKTATPVTVTYTLVAPTTITVPTTTSTTGNFTVSWAAATGVTGANYVLDVSTDGGTTFTNAYTGTATTASITGLGNGTYLYRVKATLAPYTDSAYKTSTPVRVLLTAVAPATITVPSTSITGNFTVSWGASSTSGVTYVLEKSSDGATYIQVYSGTNTSANITGLTGPATYMCRVKATRLGYVDSAYKTATSTGHLYPCCPRNDHRADHHQHHGELHGELGRSHRRHRRELCP